MGWGVTAQDGASSAPSTATTGHVSFQDLFSSAFNVGTGNSSRDEKTNSLSPSQTIAPDNSARGGGGQGTIADPMPLRPSAYGDASAGLIPGVPNWVLGAGAVLVLGGLFVLTAINSRKR